jgi:hypothetical protein
LFFVCCFVYLFVFFFFRSHTTLAIQDTGLRQSRDTRNIGHTRHSTKTIQRHRQHWSYRTQD